MRGPLITVLLFIAFLLALTWAPLQAWKFRTYYDNRPAGVIPDNCGIMPICWGSGGLLVDARLGPFPILHKVFAWPLSLAAQLADEKAKEAALLSDAQAREVSAQQRIDQQVQKIASLEASQEGRIRASTTALEKEIPFVLSPAVDRAFPLPVGLISLHDAAVTGAPLDLSGLQSIGGPHDAASPVTASAFAQTLVGNIGECRIDQSRLTGLQEAVRVFNAQVETMNRAP